MFEMLLIIVLFASLYLQPQVDQSLAQQQIEYAQQVDQSITSINQLETSTANQLEIIGTKKFNKFEIINKDGIWVLALVQAKNTKSLTVQSTAKAKDTKSLKAKVKVQAKNTKSLTTKPKPLTEFIVLPNGSKIQKGL